MKPTKQEIKATFGKQAFAPKVMHCIKCDKRMQKSKLEIDVGSGIKVEIRGFKCIECGKESFGLDEAKKLDRALILKKILAKNFLFRRKLSFDGNNYMFRLPHELTQGKHREVKILPIESNEAFIQW